MQLITSFSDDRTVAQTVDQQTQTHLPYSFPRPRLTAKWSMVDGKLKCYWMLA